MDRNPEQALDTLADDLLAERYGPPPAEYGQRDRDLAALRDANSATYEAMLLRRRARYSSGSG